MFGPEARIRKGINLKVWNGLVAAVSRNRAKHHGKEASTVLKAIEMNCFIRIVLKEFICLDGNVVIVKDSDGKWIDC